MTFDGNGQVDAANEYNPTYVPALDEQGRIRVEETTIFTVGLTLSLII